MRPEACQLSKGEEIAPVIEPVGISTRVPPVQFGSDPPPLQNEANVGFPDLSTPCLAAPGTNFKSAATCGRVPTGIAEANRRPWWAHRKSSCPSPVCESSSAEVSQRKRSYP